MSECEWCNRGLPLDAEESENDYEKRVHKELGGYRIPNAMRILDVLSFCGKEGRRWKRMDNTVACKILGLIP